MPAPPRETTPIDVARRYRLIRPTPRMPNFAAWIDGVDLTRPLDEATQAELRRALADFEVLFFRPQALTEAQHVALARVFGPLSGGSFFERHDSTPDMEMIVSDRERPPSIDVWHTDLTWQAVPPMGTVIQITETPPAGGNTCWVSTSKAFAALSPGLQVYLQGLTATHTWEVSGFRDALAARGDDALATALRLYKPVSHPVVLDHPESGRKCLYVNDSFTKCLDGIDYRESRAMLAFLNDWMRRPEFMVHHALEPLGLAVWDNRSTQHYAVADYWPHRRVNRRVTFDAPGTERADRNVNGKVLQGGVLRA
jgi:taurine dioxygenase